jgi:hypothetical protein
MTDNRKKLCVVFDIDETLIQFINKNQLHNTNWNTMTDTEKRRFDFIETPVGHVIFFRPFLRNIFKWFSANKDIVSVGLWTYSEQEYANDIAGIIQRELDLDDDIFLFKWGAEQVDDDDYPKDLSYIWGEFPHLNKFNTFIVDDLSGNIMHEHNQKNSILIQPYEPFGRNKIRTHMTDNLRNRALNDDALSQLQFICKTVTNDITGCSIEDINDSFTTESVFSDNRLKRMKLNKILKTYATKFITLPTIGESYQTNKFIDVTNKATTYQTAKKGGRRKNNKTKTKTKTKTKSKTKSKTKFRTKFRTKSKHIGRRSTTLFKKG